VTRPAYELTPCPVCGGTDAAEVADADAMRDEIEMLWAFHTRRLRAATPPGLLADRVAFSQHPPLRLARCRRCTLVYRNPRERERELRDTYAAETPDPAALGSLFENQRVSYRTQARRLTRAFGRVGSGIEVGSYVGGFLAAARERGWRFDGLDINAAASAFAQSRGFRVTLGDLASLDGDRRVDVVAIWNCFDQLPDPRRAAAVARRLLAPGGMLTVRVPNGAFYVRLRPHLRGPLAPVARALLAHNNLLGFPYRHGFTLPSLARLLGDAGFAMVRAYGDALVPIGDRWTRPWATLEERALKLVLRQLARAGRHLAPLAPWLEVYARARA
jgi:SAM-dependent methyltransferase